MNVYLLPVNNDLNQNFRCLCFARICCMLFLSSQREATMKRNLLLAALLATGMTCFADPSVLEDINELNLLKQKNRLAQGDDLREYWARREEIRTRIKPIVEQEFAKLADGELTPFASDLLKTEHGRTALCSQLKSYPVDIQGKVLEKVFSTALEAQRGPLILGSQHLSKEAFAGKEIQQWLVEAINGGKPGGAFYFILTEESARAVTETALADMKQLKVHRESLSLISAAFLACRGDEEALNALDSLLDNLDIESIFQWRYVIHVAAMSGNERLIKKILGIVTTDKRRWFWGWDCMPQYLSFEHEAALACAMVIEGFPSVEYYEYDDGTKKKVHEWIENNPTYTIKRIDPRVYLDKRFNNIMSLMSSAYR